MKCWLMSLWYSHSYFFYSGGGRPGGRDPSDEPRGAVNFFRPTSIAVPGEAYSTKIMGDMALPELLLSLGAIIGKSNGPLTCL